ncbi:MAG: YcxB family protein [Clostridiales bacterium]|nr:YcxB family protein [Clostridiales bacterium]
MQIVYYGFAAGILLAFADSFLDKRFKTAYYNNPDAGFIIFCMFYEDYVIFSRKNDENKIYYKELCKITESRDEYCFFAENDKFYILEKRGCDSRLRKYINKIKKGCKR